MASRGDSISMKIKQTPEDFQVEELTDRVAGDDGAFTLYRLEKKGWTTPDAVHTICRRWKLDARRVAYGGLKDRHAWTWQYLTIFRGPTRHLTHERLKLTYLGKVAEPFTSSDIRANRFRLSVRAWSATPAALQALEEVKQQGVPNYFDDQRFGSVSGKGEFVARALILDEFEEALRLALLSTYEFDRAAQKKEKAILRNHWGNWSRCQADLPRGPNRRLVDYLAHHPGDFRGAIDRLRPELRGLYLSAYQSHLWNRMLARWLRERLSPASLVEVPLRMGGYPMHRMLNEAQQGELAALQLPLPSARMHLAADDPRSPLVESILAEEGLLLEQMKLKGMQMFFSRGERSALCLPAEMSWESGTDDLHAGQDKLMLSFELPRGCYATLIVKRIGGMLHAPSD
jgi:tRNA pseudouridine13 synthase